MSIHNLRDYILGLFNNYKKVENSFKNRYSGSCFIIGNGPSINRLELNKLIGHYKFVTNRFILHPDYDKISPNFYCISDPDFLTMKNQNTLTQIINSVKSNSDINLFISNRFRMSPRFVRKTPSYLINYIFFQHGKTIFDEKTIETDIKQGFYFGHTVILDICIPLAFFMGFNKVYLLGCESDFSSNNSHFYGDSPKVKKQAKDISREKWFEIINSSYGYARQYFEDNDREIIDCSLNGKLTTLPKQDFSSVHI